MMDHGQPPDQKRQRVGSWSSNNLSQERPHLSLPPPGPSLPRPYLDGGSPFSGPENPLDRRRHPEQQQQQPYETESRRPSSGPPPGPPHVYNSHQPHSAPAYAPSPMVTMKREGGDDQHYSSPPSRGNGHDHNAPPPQHFGTLPPFENQNQPPGQLAYRPPGTYPPPQSPLTAPESYTHGHPAFGPHPTQRNDGYVSYPAPSAQPQKKKAQRASQACDSCRSLKAKCDEGRPTCSTCKEKNIPCVYKDPPPKQQDKATTEMLDSIQKAILAHQKDLYMEQRDYMMKQLSEVVQQCAGYGGRLTRLEQQLKGKDTSSSPPNVDLKDESNLLSPLQTVPEHPGSASDDQQGEEEYPPSTPEQRPSGLADDPEQADEAGDPVKPAPSSIPVNHTTGAARLLLVGPIAELAAGANPYKNKPQTSFDKYPLQEELKRGLIRLYGRGQGMDRPPGYEKEPIIDHPIDGTPSDTTSDPPTPPPGEEWGQIGGLTPPPEDTPITRKGIESQIGLGVNEYGIPDFSAEVVYKLVESYMDNMNNMHPILVRSGLDSLVATFLKSVQEPTVKHKRQPLESQTAGFLGSAHNNHENTGAKRKRLPTVVTENYEVQVTALLKPGHPWRSISTALVLLVLALGSICLHKERIPDLVNDKETDEWENGSQASRNGHPRSPLQTHSSVSDSTGLPSPQEAERMQPPPPTRRVSLDNTLPIRPSRVKPRNLDVIPGLAYFAFATDIIGNQMGGTSLQHVHVNILAGLYQGQLGRVIDSHAYIALACRSLQVILAPKLDRLRKYTEMDPEDAKPIPHKDNPIVFAFWTCLQLESDIVAELHLPMSGILTLEANMPLPNYKAAIEFDKFNKNQIDYYMMQLQLRKHLNTLHTMFYNPEETNERQKPSNQKFEWMEENLQNIKKFLEIACPVLHWNESDPPATDILGARLRAKYYGAEVITYRYFVLKILENSADKSPRPSNTNIINAYKIDIVSPDMVSRTTQSEDLDPRVKGYARRCIQALINSTKAFHALGDPSRHRIIVTNIWGTAHAQWGNVLTLLAAYSNNVLTDFIKKEELRPLLYTTLGFLKLNAHHGSSLGIDRKILKEVGQVVGLIPDKNRKVQPSSTPSASFGSNSGGDVSMSGY